jgi:hypothetical protein
MTCRHAYLGGRDEVQRKIELTVAATGQSVACPLGAGDRDGCHTRIVRKRRGAGESAGTTGAFQQPPGDDRPDAVDSGQLAAVLGYGRRDRFGQRLEPLVGVTDLGEQVAGRLLAGRFDRSSRTDGGQRRGGDQGREIDRGATGHQVAQQRMQKLVDQPGPLGDHVVAALVQ